MYSFTGRVFPPMRRPLHLILHHLAVHLNVSTGGNLPPQLSDAGCERLYLLRIIGRGSFTLPAIERPALRRKSAIFSLQIFFVSQQFVKRCDLPFPQKIALPPMPLLFKLPLLYGLRFGQCQRVSHRPGAQVLGLRIQMRVNVGCGGNIAVTQPLLNLLHRYTLFQQ